MTRRDLLLFLFRWKSTILGWWLFLFVLVVFLVYTKPPVFQAHSSVLVERTKAPLVIAPTITATPEMKEAMTTEAGIVRSRPVFEAVVDRLGLGKPSTVKQPGPVSRIMESLGLVNRLPPREQWVQDLASDLKAEPVVDSNLLTISYKSTDPLLAARIVNAATDAYINHRQEVYSSRGASLYLKEKRDQAEASLRELRDQLAALKARYGLSAVDDAKAQWVREIGVLRERTASLRAQAGDLETRFAPDHPRVRAVRRSISEAEGELAARQRDLASAEGRETGLKDLNARIESQQKVFFDLKTQYEEALSREQAPRDLVNSRVVEYASVPLNPRFSRLMLIQLGLVGGFVFAVLIAFLRQYFDQRIQDPEAAEAALGLPVLGSIPNAPDARGAFHWWPGRFGRSTRGAG